MSDRQTDLRPTNQPNNQPINQQTTNRLTDRLGDFQTELVECLFPEEARWRGGACFSSPRSCPTGQTGFRSIYSVPVEKKFFKGTIQLSF